jgi:superfamily II DNA helicase RecQ
MVRTAHQYHIIRKFGQVYRMTRLPDGSESPLKDTDRNEHLSSITIRAVAVNEDNKSDEVFKQIERGDIQLCYASPETLLRDPRFKKLFRSPSFRRSIVASIVDEAHVIQTWKDEFRKDYGELGTLRIISGTDVPWGAVSATMPTPTFLTAHKILSLGSYHPLWFLDLGADRPNVAQYVRKMEFPANSCAALLAFVLGDPKQPEDLPKTIYLFQSRRLARCARRLLRRFLPKHLHPLLRIFTATYSEEYKERTMQDFLVGNIRWLFCTDAAGMGCDIPDIQRVVIYGIQDLCSAMQKGGRAGRSPGLVSEMIWIIEDWVFDRKEASFESTKPKTKGGTSRQAAAHERRRELLDPGAREYVNRSESEYCMREYANDYLRPQPTLPGFSMISAAGRPARMEFSEYDSDSECDGDVVRWERRVSTHPVVGVCCSSARAECRGSAALPHGQLGESDRCRIRTLMSHNQSNSSPLAPQPTTPSKSKATTSSNTLATQSPSHRCSREEKEMLRDLLQTWRETTWSQVEQEYLFVSQDWIISDKNIDRLVNKAGNLLGAPEITIDLLDKLTQSKWLALQWKKESLISELNAFREQHHSRAHETRKRRQVRAVDSHDAEFPDTLPQTPTRTRTLHTVPILGERHENTRSSAMEYEGGVRYDES